MRVRVRARARRPGGGLAADRSQRVAHQARGQLEGHGDDHVQRPRARDASARLGCEERALAAGAAGRSAGQVQARLLGRLGPLAEARLEALPERLPRLRRARAAVARDRLHGSGRLLLGAAELADGPPRPRLHAVAPDAEHVVAASLALVRAAGEARRLQRLGLQRTLAGALRPAHLQGRRRARLRHNAVWSADRRLWAAALPRHARLPLLEGLGARELVRLTRPARNLL